MKSDVQSPFGRVGAFFTPAKSPTPRAPLTVISRGLKRRSFFPVLAFLIVFAFLHRAEAQVTLLSVVPTNGATGVSPSAPVVFTFNTAMNPALTSAIFSDVTAGFQSPSVISTWSVGNTVLTCTPSPVFANNHSIQYNVSGQSAAGTSLSGTTEGTFTTVAGVNGGSGTNAVSLFQVTKYALYNQTNSAPPPLLLYEFFAQTILTSNRTASGATVTIPVTAGVSNLPESALAPERFSKAVFAPVSPAFSNTFPSGNYVFNVAATASNQQFTVNLPGYAIANGPQLLNYTAAQSIDPSQPFTFVWNTFTNGTSADFVQLEIDAPAGNVLYESPFYGLPGALNGTATSVTMPAGTLPAGSSNNATLVFAHITASTNAGNVGLAYVASANFFYIHTTNSAVRPQLTISKAGTNVVLKWPTNATGFSLQFTTNFTSPFWIANLPSPSISSTNYVVTNGISGTSRFYRLSSP